MACQAGQTEGQKSVSKLSSLIDKFAGTLEKNQAQLTATLAEHDAIVRNIDGDLAGHYKKFSKGITTLEKQQTELAKLGAELEAAGGPFFTKWEQDLASITSEDLRERSQERMKETRERFDEMVASTKKAKETVDGIVVKLRDHAAYLANDLNVDAAKSLEKDSEDLDEDAADFKEFSTKTIAAAKAYSQSVAMRIEQQAASAPK